MATEQPNPVATIAALVVLLLSRGPIGQLVRAVQALLLPFGIHPEAARAVTEIVAPNAHDVHGPGEVQPTSALHMTVRTGVPRQAAFLFQAATRVSDEITQAASPPLIPAPPDLIGVGAVPPESRREAFGQASSERIRRAVQDPAHQFPVPTDVLDRALAKERRYFDQHLGAERGRREAAGRVDSTARRLGLTTLGWHARLDDRTTPECRAAHSHNFDVTRPPSIGYPGAVHPSCRCRPGPPFAGEPLVDELVLPSH
jgi:hypothetical protein